MFTRSLTRVALGVIVASTTVIAPAAHALASSPSTELLIAADADNNNESLGNFNFTISADNQRVLATSGERLNYNADDDLSTDLYLLDRPSHSATLASLDYQGANLGNNDTGSDATGMTDDGRYVVFSSNGDYLGEPDNVAHHDVYLRNVSGGGIVRISDGVIGHSSGFPRITPDGQYVVYTTGAYGSNDTAVIRHNVATGDEVTVTEHGHNPSISDDGTRVAYWNSSNGSVYDQDAHAFVATIAGTTVDTTEIDGNGSLPSVRPALSPDGTFVAFESQDNTLDARLDGVDPSFGPWIFVRNLTNNHLELAGVRSDGAIAGHAHLGSSGQQFSSNNRYVIFESDNPLSYIDNNADGVDVFLHDRTTGRTTLQSLDPNGYQFSENFGAGSGIVSPDGTTVVFDGDDGAFVRSQANAANRAPVAQLATFSLGSLNEFFNASSSSDPDSHIDYDHIVRYDFDFDGNGTVDQSSSSATASHNYSSPGTYQAKVTVVDSYGATDTTTTPVNVDTQYGNAVLADSPLSFYRLGEPSGPTATDALGAHNGAYSGAVTYGVSGATPTDGTTAARFDGLHAAVDLPAPTTTIGNNFSLEGWVRTSATDKSSFIATATKGNALRAFLATDTKTGTKLRFQLHDDTTHALTITGTATINDGAYHYVVAERAGNMLRLYVDRSLVASKALPNTFGTVTIDKATIGGKRVAGKVKFNVGFKGDVDEVAFYNTALDAIQMINHYNAAQGGGGGET